MRTEEMAKLMMVMSLTWPQAEVTPERIEVYAHYLEDIPTDALKAAADHLITTCVFFPSVAEWRSAAFDIMAAKHRIPTPFEAWAEVHEKMVHYGHTQQPEFSHPLIKKTVGVFGWYALCMSENSDYDRAHFTRAYAEFVQRAVDDMRALPSVRQFAEDRYNKALQDGIGEVTKKLEGGKR